MIQFIFLLILCLFVLNCDARKYLETGDTLALILGVIIGSGGILACLGKYVRRLRNPNY